MYLFWVNIWTMIWTDTAEIKLKHKSSSSFLVKYFTQYISYKWPFKHLVLQINKRGSCVDIDLVQSIQNTS